MALLHPTRCSAAVEELGWLSGSPSGPRELGTGRAMFFAGHPGCLPCDFQGSSAAGCDARPLRPSHKDAPEAAGGEGGGQRHSLEAAEAMRAPRRNARQPPAPEPLPGWARGRWPSLPRVPVPGLTWKPRGEDTLRHRDPVLGHLGPGARSPPALHGETEVRGPAGRELVDAEDCGGTDRRDRKTDGRRDRWTENSHVTRSLGAEELGSRSGGSGPSRGVLAAQREPGAPPQALAPTADGSPLRALSLHGSWAGGSHRPGGSTLLPL